jgi:carbamoyltransferase
MTGGTALNCVANMRLLERFDAGWYERNLGMKDATLHLWVPPVPGDAGVPIGAAYRLACLAGARPGESLQHAFYCGLPPTQSEIEQARWRKSAKSAICASGPCPRMRSASASPTCSRTSSPAMRWSASTRDRRDRPPRPRPPLDPCEPDQREHAHDPQRARQAAGIDPAARAMATPEAARRWFELAPGASDDDYNAYNYMVLTLPREARGAHQDTRPSSISTAPAGCRSCDNARIR